MNIFQKLKNLKSAFQVLFALNIGFILIGFYGAVKFFENNDMSGLWMAGIGTGILVVGIILPAIILRKIGIALTNAKKEIQKAGAKLVAGWIEQNQSFKGEGALKNSGFWVNLLLLGLEAYAPKMDHPAAQVITEFSPELRKEIQKAAARNLADTRKKKKRKSA